MEGKNEIYLLDLHFQGMPETIASYLMDSSEGLILFECGPHSSLNNLEEALFKYGAKMEDIKHLFLTHIHFDHAGAAWAFAEKGSQVYVHPFGYPHLQNPEKLLSSATRIYGNKMDSLWGEIRPINESQLLQVEDGQEFEIGEHRIIAHYTPGHAKHHIVWQIGDRFICGDLAGCKLLNGPVVPPCPPPDINIEQWVESINKIKQLKPSKLYLSHFGIVDQNIEAHFEALEKELHIWLAYIKPYFEHGILPEDASKEFQVFNDDKIRAAGGDDELVLKYSLANPAWMSVFGLYRYLKKRQSAT